MSLVSQATIKTIPTHDNSPIRQVEQVSGTKVFRYSQPRMFFGDEIRLNYHLYLCTYDRQFKITKGDYVLRDGSELLEVSPKLLTAIEEGHIANLEIGKILATTNKSLGLMDIPTWFLRTFCESGGLPVVAINSSRGGYCAGCTQAGIWHCAHADTCGNAEDILRPLMNDDGTISIHSNSENWALPELVVELNKYREHAMANGLSETDFDEYIQQKYFSK
jgi:hypothetical protein